MRNLPLFDQVKPIFALVNTVPSTSTPTRISMKDTERVSILILVKNATTVTGSAITLKQSTAVAGTGEKALSFTTAKRNTDLAAGNTFADFTVSSDTFTTDSTNSKNLAYLIEVKASDLDVTNNFDIIRVGTGDATAATVTVIYFVIPKKTPALSLDPTVD